MSATLKFGAGSWAAKAGSVLAYNDENNNFKPLPFTFTRASTATRVNESGLIESVASGVPRIDFLDNADGHLLLEPSRTNSALYSNDFSNAAWTKVSTTLTTDAEISPDGTQNADTITISTSDSRITQAQSLGAGTYTLSFYVKIISQTTAGDMRLVAAVDSVNTGVLFTPTTEWQRVTGTYTAATGLTVIMLRGVASGFVGTVAVYGAQLEAGSFPTSYIPTSGSSVTRADEACNSAGLDSLFPENGGGLYVEIQGITDAGALKAISISDGTLDNEVVVALSNFSDRITYYVRANNIPIFGRNYESSSGQDISQTENHKIAVRYESGNCLWAIDGQITLLTSGLDSPFAFTNNISKLSMSRGTTATSKFYGKVKSIQAFDASLSNAELISLTS